MNRVSVICTVHKQKGLASVESLCTILQRLRPEVIFLELPEASFSAFFQTRSRESLESVTIREYQHSHPFKLVLVDLPDPGEDFMAKSQQLFEKIETDNQRYRELIDLNSANVSKHGFAYLNSERCSDLWSDVYAEIRKSIRRIDDAGLMEQHDRWIKLMDDRENAMMETIRRFSQESSSTKGAFLVGAEHRQPIMDKAKAQTAVDADRIEWDFEGHRE